MRYLDKLHSSTHGMKHSVVGAVEYSAASYGFGYLQNRYREKAAVMGVPADLLAGVVLKSAALFGVGGQGVSTLMDNVGNAGLGAFFHTLGAGHGARKAGVKRLLIKESDVAKAKAALPDATILGDIPKATHGDFLSASELAAMAR